MKIVLCSNTAWSVYNFRQGLIAGIQACGHTVSVVVPPDEVHVRQLEALGCQVKQVPVDSMGLSVWRDGLLLLRYLRYFLSAKPDLVILFTIKPVIYGALATRLLSLSTICVITGLGTAFIHNNWLTRFVCFLYKVALRFPGRIFFLNKEDLKLFLAEGLVQQGEVLPGEGIDLQNFSDTMHVRPDRSAKVRHVPGSGIDLEHFTDPGPYAADARAHSGIVFLLVARMIRDKGVVEFVEAARALKSRYPSVRFQLLGFVGVKNQTAIRREEIDQWVTAGLVEYLGSAHDVRPFVREADCIVLPSYREGLPRSLLEAAAMNRPIVASDVPGCRDVVEDGVNGFLCRPRSASDLAAKLERMILLTPAERAGMGRKGREKMAREFDERIVIDRYLQAISELTITPEERFN